MKPQTSHVNVRFAMILFKPITALLTNYNMILRSFFCWYWRVLDYSYISYADIRFRPHGHQNWHLRNLSMLILHVHIALA